MSLLFSDIIFLIQFSCDLADVGIEEILLFNQFGCDSLIIIIIILLMSDIIIVSVSSCDLVDVGIMQKLFINQNGCDSLVIIIIILLFLDIILINIVFCQLEDVGIVIEILINQFGCDSVVIIIIILALLEIVVNVMFSYGLFEVSCVGGDDGMVVVDIFSIEFELFFSYSWFIGVSMLEVGNLLVGIYYVMVFSVNGCIVVDFVMFIVLEDLLINLNVSFIFCFGEIDGVVQVVVEGGILFYVYVFDGGVF